MASTNKRTDLTAHYANQRTMLVLIADYSNHWEMREKTYGYVSARIKIHYKQGADFFAHLNLIAQPAIIEGRAALPPNLQFEEEDDPFRFQIERKRVTVSVPLDVPQLWGKTKDTTNHCCMLTALWRPSPYVSGRKAFGWTYAFG